MASISEGCRTMVALEEIAGEMPLRMNGEGDDKKPTAPDKRRGKS